MAVATTIVPEMGDPSKMELTSRWVFRSGSESYGSEPVSSSSTMSDSSHSLSISDSDDFNRTIIANPKESLFQPGELQKGYVEVPMHSDVLFVNLPQRVVDALLHSRRIVVEGDGKIRSLPFDSDEFSNLEPHTDEGINPLQRRVLHALGKENITKGSESSEKMRWENATEFLSKEMDAARQNRRNGTKFTSKHY
ncbi:hypothetical protein Y032_0021g330 [Ancylostoma ceylanicum]|uniref:Uncharacterized protein n=1 Tax=Ancylostoma ceylanicum TaxID=53326 RepID=A0A016V1P0_9BILA|nr:hypothetical protein Y032_0021g330 [Ancylostoma ceylanicum]